jgi:molecular chaperone GrpE
MNDANAAADTPAAPDSAAPGSSAELQSALASLKDAGEARLRALAELDNIRKRAQRDVENAQRYALERFAAELLAVRDSLELAAGSAAGRHIDAAALVAGQQATLQLLQSAFEKFAIQQINPSGAVFDPQLHEAVLAQPTDAVPVGTVLEVLQAGYQLNGRLLRPARVIVAAAPAASP